MMIESDVVVKKRWGLLFGRLLYRDFVDLVVVVVVVVARGC